MRVVHETRAVPFLARFVVELRIREKPEAKHAGRFAVNLFVDPGRLRLDLLVQPEAVFIRLGRGAEAGFVDQPEGLEAFAARILSAVEHLEQVHQPEAVLRDMIPEMLVAAAPEVPGVAAHDLVRRERDPAIQRLENVGRDLRKIVRRKPGQFGFVLGGFATARAKHGKQREGARSD